MKAVTTDAAGLAVSLDKLIYRYDARSTPPGCPHVFTYFLSIQNTSGRNIRIDGRRWVLESNDGHKRVVEGNSIAGRTPVLAPGESYRYNSFHLLSDSVVASGSLHGVDSNGNRLSVEIPRFDMTVEEDQDV